MSNANSQRKPAQASEDEASRPAAAPEGVAAAAGGPEEDRLRLRDVRAVFRLVGEVRELGADPGQWRPHMVSALRKLLKAEIVVSSEVHFRKAAGTGAMKVVDIGWISEADGHVCKVHTEREHENLEDFWLAAAGPGIAPAGKTPGLATATGDELVPIKPTRALYGGKSFLMSQYPVLHAGAVDQLGLHRAWGDGPFTRAQHRLVRMLHVELGRLWRRDAIRRVKQPGTDLPPRLTQTLEALLEGRSEKEIAAKLGLSRHTVHNYVKALHQRFGVSSRGELLARAGKEKEKEKFTPQLSLETPRGK